MKKQIPIESFLAEVVRVKKIMKLTRKEASEIAAKNFGFLNYYHFLRISGCAESLKLDHLGGKSFAGKNTENPKSPISPNALTLS